MTQPRELIVSISYLTYHRRRDGEKVKFAELVGSSGIIPFAVNNILVHGVFWAQYQDKLSVHAAIWRVQNVSLVNSCIVERLSSFSGRTWTA
mmetsp:Transcript_9939/g.31924  ORF Transcript_9939/g.31924 Transcript_9939/m.31924 type:complete len:92 (-) Transcript_9939:279-554(-)